MSIKIADVGEILKRIDDAEIPFRLENVVAVGFRWALVGFEGELSPGEMRLYRAELDDWLQGALQIPDKMPDVFRCYGLNEEDFTIKDARERFNSLHIQQKDWLVRAESEDILVAINGLSQAALRYYPNSDFAEWFLRRGRRPTSELGI